MGSLPDLWNHIMTGGRRPLQITASTLTMVLRSVPLSSHVEASRSGRFMEGIVTGHRFPLAGPRPIPTLRVASAPISSFSISS